MNSVIFNNPKVGCSFCNPDHDSYFYAECLCEDGDGGYEILIETSEWSEYDDSYVVQAIKHVKFCPYCGRKMVNK